jgi:hypothetical protein
LTDTTVLALATHCRRLKELELWHATLSDTSIIALANNCPLLSTLDIQSCGHDDDITDACLIAVAERYPLLRHLNVSLCPGITNAGIIAIARGCPLLERIGFTDCFDVSDEAVRVIAEVCPLVWIISCRMPSLSRNPPDANLDLQSALSRSTSEWLDRHVPLPPNSSFMVDRQALYCLDGLTRQPKRLSIKDLLVLHPPPWRRAPRQS